MFSTSQFHSKSFVPSELLRLPPFQPHSTQVLIGAFGSGQQPPIANLDSSTGSAGRP